MLKNPEALENIIAASPGLEDDPVAMGQYLVQVIVVSYKCNSLTNSAEYIATYKTYIVMLYFSHSPGC